MNKHAVSRFKRQAIFSIFDLLDRGGNLGRHGGSEEHCSYHWQRVPKYTLNQPRYTLASGNERCRVEKVCHFDIRCQYDAATSRAWVGMSYALARGTRACCALLYVYAQPLCTVAMCQNCTMVALNRETFATVLLTSELAPGQAPLRPATARGSQLCHTIEAISTRKFRINVMTRIKLSLVRLQDKTRVVSLNSANNVIEWKAIEISTNPRMTSFPFTLPLCTLSKIMHSCENKDSKTLKQAPRLNGNSST